jgi:hypothetical protein
MPEKDYSKYITNPVPKEDDRPFWLRLLLSLRPSLSFSTKKVPSSDDIKKGVKLKITGGADF